MISQKIYYCAEKSMVRFFILVRQKFSMQLTSRIFFSILIASVTKIIVFYITPFDLNIYERK